MSGTRRLTGIKVEYRLLTLPKEVCIGDPYCLDDPDSCCPPAGSGSGSVPSSGGSVGTECCDEYTPLGPGGGNLFLTMIGGSADGTYELTWDGPYWYSEILESAYGGIPGYMTFSCGQEVAFDGGWFAAIPDPPDPPEDIILSGGRNHPFEPSCPPFYAEFVVENTAFGESVTIIITE